MRVGRLELSSSNLGEWAATLADFVLGGLSSGVKALGLVPGNGGLIVVSLLKALFGDWTFSRVKTQDLTMMVRPNDDGICAL